MELSPDIDLHVKLKRWSRYLAVAVALIALFVLVGWGFDIELLKRCLPGMSAMNPVTAVCFIISAFSVLLISKQQLSEYKSILSYALASVVLLIGITKIVGFLTGSRWQIDQVLFPVKIRQDAVDTIASGMAPNTALCFLLTGISLWLPKMDFRRTYMWQQIVLSIIAIIGWLSVLGYLYRVQSFYGVLDFKPMSLYSAFCFLFISLALMFANPGRGIVKQVTSPFGGSVTARFLLPAAVLVPSILGFLRLYGDRAGIYSTEFAVALYTLSFIIIFLCLIWYSAYVLNKRDMLKKETEVALQDSEEQVSAIFKAAPDAVVVIDSEGRIMKWNPEAEKLFKWSAQEINGKLLSETIIPIQFREAHLKGMQRFLNTGETAIIGKTVEIQAIKKDNTEFDIALRVAPVVIKNSHMFVGFIRDITEKKKIDQRLKTFNEELALQVEEKTKEITEIFERLSDGFIALDNNFCYTYLNKKAGELIHRDTAALIGKNVWHEFPDVVGSQTYLAFNKAMKEQKYVSNTDYYAPLNLWQENNIYPSAHGLSVFIKDISNKKRAEIALQEKEEKYRTFVEEAVDAILVLSADDHMFIEANKKATQLFGYSTQELLNMRPVDLAVAGDKMPVPYKELESGEAVRVERFLRKKDGTTVEVELSARRLPDGNFLAFIRDITQRKNAEEELVRLNEELRTLTNYLQKVREEERTHIAREIHDELGQQLTVMKMDAAWVNKKVDQSDEPLKQKINDLLSMIDTTVRTVRRISSELRPSLLDDLGLVPAMEWHLEEFEKRSGIEKRFISPAEEIKVSDEMKIGIFRILQESLTNVARHSGAKKVHVSLEQFNKKVILTITDDGQGFDTDEGSKKTLGILGMKERTLMLGGEYSIEGIRGVGTTVRVVMPLDTVSQ